MGEFRDYHNVYYIGSLANGPGTTHPRGWVEPRLEPGADSRPRLVGPELGSGPSTCQLCSMGELLPPCDSVSVCRAGTTALLERRSAGTGRALGGAVSPRGAVMLRCRLGGGTTEAALPQARHTVHRSPVPLASSRQPCSSRPSPSDTKCVLAGRAELNYSS